MNNPTKESVDKKSIDQIIQSLKKIIMTNAFAESSINATTKLTIRTTGDDPSRTYSMISSTSNENNPSAENSKKFKTPEKFVTASCPECGTKITMFAPNKKNNTETPKNSAMINSETNSFIAENPLACCSGRQNSHTESSRTPNTVNKKSSLMKSSRAPLRLANSPRRSIIKKSAVKTTLSPCYKSAGIAGSSNGNISFASGSSTSTPRNSIPYRPLCSPRISEIRAYEIGQYDETNANSSSAFKSPLRDIRSFSKTFSIEKSQTPSPVRRERKFENGRVSRVQFSKNDKCRRRSNSTKNIPALKKPIINRRSQSANAGSVKSEKINQANDPLNRFGKSKLPISSLAKKPETKIPVPKKALKIEQVQQGKFGKIEKSADAKKQQSARTDQNAINLIAAPSKRSRLSAETAIPTDAVDGGVYNRYGYRLRKHEVMVMISQKLPTHARDKRTENRILQQCIRVDQRFNASMERRNKRWI